MPFPFVLPTTSSVLLTAYYESVTHPSLALTATSKRNVLRSALKHYKRLPAQSKDGDLTTVQAALLGYLPYLLALNTGSGYRDVGPEKLDVEVKAPLLVEWRSTLSSTLPGRENARPKLTGLHHELAFVFSTLAYTHTLLARSQLRMLQASKTASAEQRTASYSSSMKHLLEAHSVHAYLLSLPTISAAKDAPVDIQPSTISALSSLALAEASLLFVAKDDPYTAAVADDRNESNTDWMFKAPTIPKVRAHLFARICLSAAEHAGQAAGLLARGNAAGAVDEDLVKYVNDFRRTARGKAARMLAIDAELSGKTGEALAWLQGARKELGLAVEVEEGGKRKGFRGLKQSWQERREDRKVEKGGEWGLDAGRLEEARVVEMLEAKWDRENSTVNVQVVPPYAPLLASMPSGRDPLQPQAYVPPTLDADAFARMRAPPEPDEAVFRGDEDDSGNEDGFGGRNAAPVGAFPGTAGEYGRSGTSQSYY